MYDFRLISTLGFTSEDETSFEKMDGVRSAEGSKSVDLLMEFDGNILPYTVLAIPEKINLPSLMEGRMPDADSECIADANVFNAEDIGKTITVAAENAEDSADKLKTKNIYHCRVGRITIVSWLRPRNNNSFGRQAKRISLSVSRSF